MGSFERRWRARSRRHWAILIACLAIVGVGVWLAIGERVGPRVVLLPTPVRAAPSKADVTVESAAEPTMPIASGGQGNERVDVCGLGWVEAGADGSVDAETLARMPALVAARSRLLASLASSDDAFERAASLWLKTTDPASATLAGDFREQLALSAMTTSDPRLYAMAFKTCMTATDAASCALLNARRWAQLDGGNGEPWIFVLDEALTRKDRPQADDALFHLAASERFDDRFFAVPALFAARTFASDTLLLAAHELAFDALALAATAVPPLQAVLDACRPSALAETDRRQRCDTIAATFVDRSDTLLFATIGARLGRSFGWPPKRLESIAALSSASDESMSPRQIDSSPYACRRVAALLDRLGRQKAIGEVRFAREWIEGQGLTVERYAARQVDRQRRRSVTSAPDANTSLLAGAFPEVDAPASAAGR